MSEDPDLALLELLWSIKGGSLSIKSNGKEQLSISRTGDSPEIDVHDLDYVLSMMPNPRTMPLMEKLRRLSRDLSKADRNLIIKIEGEPFMNFGKQQNILSDVENFADLFMKKAGSFLKEGRTRLTRKR